MVSVAKRIKQLGIESAIYGVSGTLSRAISFLLVPVYTRLFTPSDYGIMALLNPLSSLIGMFAVLGLDNSSARWFYDSDEESRRRTIISSWFWCQLLVSALLGTVLLVTAPFVTARLLGSPERSNLVRLAAVTVPLLTFRKVVGNWLRYQRRARDTALLAVATSLVAIGFTLLFVVVWRRGLPGAYAARLLAGALAAVVALGILRSWISPAHFSRHCLAEMLGYGLPLVPAAVASWATTSADRYILTMYHPRAEVGLYSIAVSVAAGAVLVTGAFQAAWGPFAFSIYHEPQAESVYARVLSVYALLGGFLGTVVSLFAEPIIRILAPEEYLSAATAVPYLAFAHLLMGAIYITGIGSGIAKRSTRIATGIFVGAAVNVAVNFALVPDYGKVGAGMATLLANIVIIAYRYHMSQRDHYIPYRIRDLIVCFGFAGILIAVASFLPALDLWSLALRGILCLAFVPLALVLGIVRPVHLRRLVSSLRRPGFAPKGSVSLE